MEKIYFKNKAILSPKNVEMRLWYRVTKLCFRLWINKFSTINNVTRRREAIVYFFNIYYVPYNKDLDNWLAKTPNKSLAELPFDTFGEEHRKINCVKDARQEFQKILKKDRTLSCTSSK